MLVFRGSKTSKGAAYITIPTRTRIITKWCVKENRCSFLTIVVLRYISKVQYKFKFQVKNDLSEYSNNIVRLGGSVRSVILWGWINLEKRRQWWNKWRIELWRTKSGKTRHIREVRLLVPHEIECIWMKWDPKPDQSINWPLINNTYWWKKEIFQKFKYYKDSKGGSYDQSTDKAVTFTNNRSS